MLLKEYYMNIALRHLGLQAIVNSSVAQLISLRKKAAKESGEI